MSCLECGEETHNPKFCSLSCSSKYTMRYRERKDKGKTCKQCQSEFQYQDPRQKFCSRSCAATYNNTHKKVVRPVVNCKYCGKETTWVRMGTCSHECMLEWNIRGWLEGSIDGSRKYTYASFIRVYLGRRSNEQCEECGEDRKRSNGQSILQVDHIDGNWENNTVDNLRLICPTCHALTDNYGALNMGNGRKWKKKYSQF